MPGWLAERLRQHVREVDEARLVCALLPQALEELLCLREVGHGFDLLLVLELSMA